MSRYHHLTLNDRECLLVGLTLKQSYRVIAQLNYARQRLNSRRPRILSKTDIRTFVINCIVHRKWSPEQITGRLSYERSEWQISYNTIYRGIALNNLGEKYKSHGARGFARQLRHHGKTRKVKGTIRERRDRLEAYHSLLKKELINQHTYSTLNEIRLTMRVYQYRTGN